MNQSNQRVVNNKLGLLNLADELSNIARACRVMGVSRDTFYRYRDAVEHGGVDALLNKTRRKPNFKNRVDEAAERAVCDWAIASPAHGQAGTSNELQGRYLCFGQRRTQHLATPRPGEFPQTAQGAGRKSRTRTVHSDRSTSDCTGEKETRRRSVR